MENHKAFKTLSVALSVLIFLPMQALASSPKLFEGVEGTELSDVEKLIKNATDILLLLGGIAFFAMLLWGSVTIGTAAGNEERLANGKKTLTAAIVGLLIVIGAKIIVEYAIKFLGGSIV